MFGIINIAINLVVLVMLFGVYSKLSDLSIAIKRLSKPVAPPSVPVAPVQS